MSSDIERNKHIFSTFVLNRHDELTWSLDWPELLKLILLLGHSVSQQYHHLVSIWEWYQWIHTSSSYFQNIHFYNTKKLNIILASRPLVTVNLLNSSVVYNEIISIARTSLNKNCLSSFCTVKNFALSLPRRQELQPHSQSHLFRISSSEKLSLSASVIMTTTTLAACFEGLIPH
jgi:hypothetical protein